ncbi:MAG: leucyl/phenylalanyl-tRNA--protein transferase [Bacteroidetes bacterium HGW-Bacteroidetes-2]|jgi:leucyl/phenylalanyl-tRNA--protein transferase|nr:MAG: leucyl/phenylalanyl-tRNA--protein transferase [Bacteroidetes bacterium HGW-Bacteroidetes-2]
MVYLKKNSPFPDVSFADEDGLLAIGGALTSERLLLAYYSGIFPWFSEGQPVLWWSPNPRMVLFIENFKTSKSLLQSIRNKNFTVTFNLSFTEVIANCSKIQRPHQDGTWITNTMQKAYQELHRLGHAISVEVWQEDQLVGGLYGVDLPEKNFFCGESMFSKVSNASKIALYFLVEKLKKENYIGIDCQVYTNHLATLGAKEIDRKDFLKFLA